MQELRRAFRTLFRHPAPALMAVAALALGIGMTISIFTLVNAILIRPLPYPDADRLVVVWGENREQGWDHEKISFPELIDWQKSGLFDAAIGFTPDMGIITAPGNPELVHAYALTAGAIAMLGVQPGLGRAFTSEEERPGGPRAVILRYDFWLRRYNGDRNVIGQTLVFNDKPFVIVGVMPAGFEFFNRESDLLFPSEIDPATFTWRGRVVRVLARLKPGLSLSETESRANVISANFAERYPETNRGWSIRLSPLTDDAAGPVRPALLTLMGAVALVLLIACSNVASLLLAQAAARSKESAVRIALGASRWRLIRQTMTESLLLSAMGGVLGLGLAALAVRYFRESLPARTSAGRFLVQLDRIRIDPWVIAFALAIVPIAALIFGIVPALRTSRSQVNEGLKDASRGGTVGRGARRAQSFLVIAQIAVAVVLVIGAGLLVRSFGRLYEQGPGFDPSGLKTINLQLPAFEVRGQPRAEVKKWIRTTYDQVMNRVAALPGIERAASVSDLPIGGFYNIRDFTIENRVERGPADRVHAIDRWVTPNYFETMRIPLRAGRYFNRFDGEDQPRVLIVSEAFARQYFGGESPVGRRMKLGLPEVKNPWYTIVGVVAGERIGGMEEELRPIVYLSTAQSAASFFYLIVRSRMDLSTTLAAIRTELTKINPKLVPYAPSTFDTLVLDSTWRVRYSMLLLGALAFVSLVMALVGVYGVISYGVSQRTAEIGVRMALGARNEQVLSMITREGLRLGLIGVTLGLILAAVLTRLLSSLLFGVNAIDWPTYLAVAALLVVVAGVASYVPARRAAALDPIAALRHE